MKIISGKRMCRVLEQRGWTLARINGAHHIYRHAGTFGKEDSEVFRLRRTITC